MNPSRQLALRLITFCCLCHHFAAPTVWAGPPESKSEITSPPPGATLDGQTHTFTWTAGVDAQAYQLYAGSTMGGADYFDSGGINALSITATNLPTDESAVFVRLWTLLPAAGWVFSDYEYTASLQSEIIDPIPGSIVPGPNVSFRWTSIATAEGYHLQIGSAEGGADYLDSGPVTTTDISVAGLPVDGSTVYARLTTIFPGLRLLHNDYTFQTLDIDLDREDDFQVANLWPGSSLNLPPNLGGLMFSRDGNTLYVVGASENINSALYAVPVRRDPATRTVIGLGSAEDVSLVFFGDPNVPGLDAGWEFGPDDTLFYTYWRSNQLGQRPGGFSGTESLFDMGTLGVPASIAGLTFSPHLDDPVTGFGMMQISVWQGADILNVPLDPLGGGLFRPVKTELFVTLPRQGTGAIQYIPSGVYAGNLMYVNWDHGEVLMIVIDQETGLPVDDATGQPTLGTANPRAVRFASGLGVGPWGLEFDPFTNDFFVSTWAGTPANTIIHFSGSGLPAPSGATRIIDWSASAGRLFLEWEGPVGWEHTVEFSTDLATWSDILVVPAAPAFNRRSFVSPAAGEGFVRVRVNQFPDP